MLETSAISRPEAAPGSPLQNARALRSQRRSTSRRPPRRDPSHDDAPDAGMVVARIHCVPTSVQEGLKPSAEIHGIGINRNADVAKIAGAIPRGNVHAPAESYGERREVAAYTNPFMHGIAGATGGARIRIAEADLRVHEIANRLHTLATAQYHPEIRPGEISELVAIAIPALE